MKNPFRKNGYPFFCPFLYYLIYSTFFLRILRGLVDKVAVSHPRGLGSIPGVAFILFENNLDFSQTFWVNNSFLRVFASKPPCPLKSQYLNATFDPGPIG